MKTAIHKFIQNTFGIKLIQLLPKPAILEIKKRFGDKKLIGVEIGTYKGDNAVSILKTLNMKKLYLIDPYIFHDDWDSENEMGEIVDNEILMEEIKAEAKFKVMSFYNKYEFVERFSKDAVNYIPNELDFVYIDGAHDFNSVMQDLNNYYPKIKRGGILCGHDADYNPVTQALIKFCYENKLKLNISKHDDWWIIIEGKK